MKSTRKVVKKTAKIRQFAAKKHYFKMMDINSKVNPMFSHGSRNLSRRLSRNASVHPYSHVSRNFMHNYHNFVDLQAGSHNGGWDYGRVRGMMYMYKHSSCITTLPSPFTSPFPFSPSPFPYYGRVRGMMHINTVLPLYPSLLFPNSFSSPLFPPRDK